VSERAPGSTALIIGASRGLGLAMADEYLKRGWRVIGTVRGTARTGLHDLADKSGGRLEIEHVDIADASQIAALRQRLAVRTLDLLFVNAGVSNGAQETFPAAGRDEFFRLMTANTYGPMSAIEALHDLVRPAGTIGVMSSGLASITNNVPGGWENYRASKAALNMLMRSYAARTSATPRTLLCIAPGWVRTDMGGPSATLGIDESIPRVVDVMLAQAGRPGLQYLNYQGETLPW
jgi:NAD(P)-dependent dehydrogenase (short-subunit alcohol dehydrogenase family)